ncbi:MAG: ABC transporter permease subunit [Candidatus Eiseniibacteriota bacterium]
MALVALSVVLAAIFLAIGVALAARWPDRIQALGAGLLVWLLATVLYDLAAVGITSVVYGLPVRRILVIAVWLNPVDLCRVLATSALGSHALFGPSGAAIGAFLARPLGAAATVASLAFWTAVPLALAVRAFGRRDF